MTIVIPVKEEKRFLIAGSFIFLLIIALTFLNLLSGSIDLGLKELFSKLFSENDGSASWLSLHEFRIPRYITAVISGIALSVSGLQMQTVFRNPLAGPYVLGISSGAGLGVALLVLGFPGLFKYSALGSENGFLLILSAWTGATAILLLILLASLKLRNVMTVLIFGIMLGSGISALISIMQYFSREASLKAFVIWTMGSLGGVTIEQIPYLLLGFFPGLFLAIIIIKPSNAMLLGENYAKSLGLNVLTYRVLVFSSTALLTGTVTAFCGPIGFIGIAVPHIARMIAKTSRFGVLFFLSILIGTAIMLISDLFTRFPGNDLVLPINAVTSLIGIPVVIWIITRKRSL